MIELTRGDSRVLNVTVYSDEAMTTPQNLTSATAIRFTARKNSEAGAQVFQKTLGAGVAVVDAAAGTLTVSLVPADTSSLPAKLTVLAYDLEITWVGGAVTTAAIGQLRVVPDVSYS